MSDIKMLIILICDPECMVKSDTISVVLETYIKINHVEYLKKKSLICRLYTNLSQKLKNF